MPLGGLLTLGIGALAPTIGGIVGNIAGAGSRKSAEDLQKQALQNIMDINTPDINQMQLALQQYQSQGQMNPEMVGTVNLGPSEMAGISADPRLRQAQMAALEQLQQVGEGGLRPEDKAALAQIQQQTAQDERAREQSIIQNMQERGIAGGGAELASKLAASQGAANRASQEGLDVGALASQRALQAIMNAGSLGSQMESQQFGEESQKAAAQDIINKYNAMNQQQILGQNVGSRNMAQAQNLEQAQNIANQNVNLANQQQQYNKQLAQQNFQNQLAKTSAAAGQQQNLAGMYNQQSQQAAQMGAGIGAGLGQAATAYGAYKPKQAAPTQSPSGVPSSDDWSKWANT